MQDAKAILLIEDDEDVRGVVSNQLTELGYSVTACEYAEEAVAKFGAGCAYAAVVTDVVMPGTSGLELSTLIRRWAPRTPIVLITGNPDGVESAVNDGRIALVKPFTSDQLGIVLSEALLAAANRSGATPGRATIASADTPLIDETNCGSPVPTPRR